MKKSLVAEWRIKNKKAQLSISIPEELHAKFKETCKARGTSMTTVLITFIKKYIEENE